MTTGTSQTLTWWEKSVEYQFIADAVTGNVFTLLTPLDGDVERVGDTVFAKDASYIIVEFKRRLLDFKSEYKKYWTQNDPGGEVNFRRAKAELEKDNGAKHHLLVAGSIQDKQKPKLTVDIFEYFSCEDEPPTKLPSIQAAAASGVTKEIFDTYVFGLSKYKGGNSDSESRTEGSNSGGKSTNPIVIGVSPTRATTIITLEDYSRALKLSLAPRAPKTRHRLG